MFCLCQIDSNQIFRGPQLMGEYSTRQNVELYCLRSVCLFVSFCNVSATASKPS